MEILNYILDS